VTSPCCEDEQHMPNRRKRTFLEETLADLEVFKKGLKDVLFSNNLRFGRVMDPWVGLRHLPNEEIWGKDPVHLRNHLYEVLVDGVLITEAKIGGKRKQEGNSSQHNKMP
jgi:hypothetical protein